MDRFSGVKPYVTEKNLGLKTKAWLKSIAPHNTHRMKLNPRKTALLVIDMQNDFLLPRALLWTQGGVAVLSNIARLVRACRKRRVPVIYTAHVHQDPKVDGGMTAFWWPDLMQKRALVSGKKGAAVIKSLAAKPGEPIILKHRYSAFYNTELEVVLRGLGVEDLIITGVMTNICCESTARDAFVRDFRVFFLADATGSGTEELHVGALRNLAYAFAYVTTTQEVLKRLNP